MTEASTPCPTAWMGNKWLSNLRPVFAFDNTKQVVAERIPVFTDSEMTVGTTFLLMRCCGCSMLSTSITLLNNFQWSLAFLLCLFSCASCWRRCEF